jgi:hypothetical protein
VSVLWLKKGASVIDAVELLEKNAAAIGLGQIYYGPTLALNYNVGGLDPGEDPRTPDIIVTPDEGVTYSGSTTMIGDHGGFAHDDTNVVMLVANPHFSARTVSAAVTTAQVAPTIVQEIGYRSRNSGVSERTSSIVVTPAATFSAPAWRNGRMPAFMAISRRAGNSGSSAMADCIDELIAISS